MSTSIVEPAFERQMKVAWSCLKEVQAKIDQIKEAKERGDREVDQGTFRGTMAATALQGRLEREFEEELTIAWNAAQKAAAIDPDGTVEVEPGVAATPNVVFGDICGVRGDLKFSLERWDEAVTFYKQGLQYFPDSTNLMFNLGAACVNRRDPAQAIQAFEKVVESDPTGEFGIQAEKNLARLRASTAGAKGEKGSASAKRFTGSWKIAGALGFMAVFSCFLVFVNPQPGIINVVFWGGILALYVRAKYK